MSKRTRILVVCPSYPAPESGAEQQDRADGLRQLVRLGYDVHVLAKIPEHASREAAEKSAQDIGVGLTLVPYCFSNRKLTWMQKMWKQLGKFRNPFYLDGAAYEYAEPVIQQKLHDLINTLKPDIAFFEYTYLWACYPPAQQAGIPIVVRSANFEPEHFLEENGRSLLNYLKFIPKFMSEWITIRKSTVLFSITPDEQKIYERHGARTVKTLPLRSLPRLLKEMPITIVLRNAGGRLNVFFLGSSYNVTHNRAAAAQVIEQIAPLVEERFPNTFSFHIFGAKLPQYLAKKCDGTRIVYEGYVPDLAARLREMDIALLPSLMGCGQQQKVFEPLARGFPAIISPRAIASYDFVPGTEYLPALNTEEFVGALGTLLSFEKRKQLGESARAKSEVLFLEEKIDAVVHEALSSIGVA